jgi:hypothetical protein
MNVFHQGFVDSSNGQSVVATIHFKQKNRNYHAWTSIISWLLTLAAVTYTTVTKVTLIKHGFNLLYLLPCYRMIFHLWLYQKINDTDKVTGQLVAL